MSLRRQIAGTEQDGVEHRASETAGVRVLPARVVAPQERRRARDRIAAGGSLPRHDRTSDVAWECPDARRSIVFHAICPKATTTRTRSRSSISRARYGAQAASSSGVGLLSGGAQRAEAVMNASEQREAVAQPDRRRLVREPRPVKGGIEPVTGIVAGEHPSGAIRSVRRRRQSAEQYARVPIAEPGDRSSPVGFVAERSPLDARDLLAVCAQTGTARAGDDLRVQPLPGNRRGLSAPRLRAPR